MIKIINSLGNYIIIYKEKIIYSSNLGGQFKYNKLVKYIYRTEEIFEKYINEDNKIYFSKNEELICDFDLWIAFRLILDKYKFNN